VSQLIWRRLRQPSRDHRIGEQYELDLVGGQRGQADNAAAQCNMLDLDAILVKETVEQPAVKVNEAVR